MVDREEIGRRVYALRDLAGLTQAKLAANIGVTTETISRTERGLYDPALSTLVAVADELDVALDYLVGRSDPKGKKQQSALVVKLVGRVARLSPQSQRVMLKLSELLR